MNYLKDVKPSDISLESRGIGTGPFAGFFGMAEMETVAELIVELCLVKDGWRTFTETELYEISGRLGSLVSWGLSSLLLHGWIERTDPYGYEVTLAFVERIVQRQAKLSEDT